MESALPENTRRRIPRQKRARDRVEKILDAAGALLEQDSAEKLNTAAIAKKAGIPVGSLYQYFPNKTAVIVELARRVMLETDLGVLTILKSAGEINWEESVDLAVDATLNNYQQRPGYLELLRGLSSTAEFSVISAESNERIAAYLASHTQLRQLNLPRDRIRLIARAAIQASNALQDWALSTGSEAGIRAIGTEMKTMMKAYIGRYVETVGYRK